jgi:hypothetical protein
MMSLICHESQFVGTQICQMKERFLQRLVSFLKVGMNDQVGY